MGELLRGWHLSAVQKSNPKFRHFSKASLIHLNVTSLQTRAETPVEDMLLSSISTSQVPTGEQYSKGTQNSRYFKLKNESWWCTVNRQRFSVEEHLCDWFKTMEKSHLCLMYGVWEAPGESFTTCLYLLNVHLAYEISCLV